MTIYEGTHSCYILTLSVNEGEAITGGSIVSISQTGSVGSRTAIAIVENQIAVEIIKIGLSRRRAQQEVVGTIEERAAGFVSFQDLL